MVTIYEDEFVLLTDYKLVVKNFHFPSKRSKNIAIDQISIVWFEEQDTCNGSATKTWGKTSADVYWALDLKRCLHTGHRWNMVIDYGAKQRIGFSVEDGEEFMEAMRNSLDYHVIIVNYINL